MLQHEEALAAYVDGVRARPEALAVVAVGSVARGDERPDSDVDVYLVVTDDHFAEAVAHDRFAWIERRGQDYPGSYIDIKLASPRYLAAAAERGDDPTRASFRGARVAFSRMEGLPELLERIATLPSEVWDQRVRSYLAQAHLYGGYFLRQAVERGDEFLLRHASVHLSLAAARALLAHARILMPGPKYISALVSSTPAPPGFRDAWERVLRAPSTQTAATLLAVLDRLVESPLSGDEKLSVFIRDNELTWLRGTTPAEFW